MKSVFQNIQRQRENTLSFQLSPTHVAYANTLRRLIMTSVETVGFRADIADNGSTTDVEILANSTPMTNEMLAHRIGLLPIHVKTPLDWDSEKYTFVLNKVNETDDIMDVYASDFRILEKRGEESITLPPQQFFVPHAKTRQTCLIATLKPLMPGGKPEEIHLKAKATVGVGRENARFIPTAQCAYAYTRDNDPIHVKAAFDDWVQRAKKIDPATLETDPVKKEPLVREFKTLEIQRCYMKNEAGEPYSFDFTVESAGVLDPEYIVQRACEKGAEMCKAYAAQNLSDDVTVARTEGRMIGYDFFFQRQDHTLGHLVQAWLDENLVGRGDITFAGYDIPHPLRDEMVIRIGVRDGSEAVARKALSDAMTACAGMFQAWRDQWASQMGPAPAASAAAASAPAPVRRVVRRPAQTAVA